MVKGDHFPNVGFVCRAFLYSVRFLLTHPVYGSIYRAWGGFLNIISVGILTYAGVKTGFYGWHRREKQFSCQRRPECRMKQSLKTNLSVDFRVGQLMWYHDCNALIVLRFSWGHQTEFKFNFLYSFLQMKLTTHGQGMLLFKINRFQLVLFICIYFNFYIFSWQISCTSVRREMLMGLKQFQNSVIVFTDENALIAQKRIEGKKGWRGKLRQAGGKLWGRGGKARHEWKGWG